jgi:hypothetical protein
VTHAIIIKTEEFSDAEVVEGPVAITFPGIKDDPVVSCVSVSMLRQFHEYTTSRFTSFSTVDDCHFLVF